MAIHNKKRNTAVLFEILVKEQAKAILSGKTKKAKLIEKLVKKFFHRDNILSKELELYNCLTESSECKEQQAEKLIYRVKQEREKLDEAEIFGEQSKLISIINKTLGPAIFENFVQNYKHLASINIMFNQKNLLSERLKMEDLIKESLTRKESKKDLIKDEVNILVFKKYVENFNKEYSNLIAENKELLNKYILNKFGDETSFKVYITAECLRIINSLKEHKEKIKEKDQVLYENISKCIKELEEYPCEDIDDEFIYSVMKYQELASELEKDQHELLCNHENGLTDNLSTEESDK